MCSLYLGENLISGSKPINLGMRNIGEIVSSSLPLTDAGLHLLDGSLILGGGIYQGFVDYIANIVSIYPDVFTTESAWQASVSTYGSCGKFVYNATDNTVRLPKVSDILQGTTDVSTLGDLVEAGLPSLPQHTHSYTRYPQGSKWFTKYRDTGGSYSTENYWSYQTVQSGNASTVDGGLYGASSTVQPQTIKVLYYIVIATSTKTEIQSDIDEVVTDLNGKADTDLTNTTDQAKILMGGMAMPSDKYINLTLGSSGTQYTAPANGWVYIYGTVAAWNYVDLVGSGMMAHADTDNNAKARTLIIPVSANENFMVGYSDFTVSNFKFIYAVGSESEAS